MSNKNNTLIQASDMRVGDVIMYNGKMYAVKKIKHVQPGKGGAMINTEAKELNGGSKMEHRFNVETKVEKVDLFTEDALLMFYDESAKSFDFFITSSSEQVTVLAEDIENYELLLSREWDQDNTYNIMVGLVMTNDGEVVYVKLPPQIACKVIEAPSYIKGQTETAKPKIVVVSNGLNIKTPQMINSGDIINVNTETLDFTERLWKAS